MRPSPTYWGVLIVALVGCTSQESTPTELRGPTTLAPPEGPVPRSRGGGPQSFEELQRLSEAICSRERRCGNVGPGGRWASRTECIGAVSEDATHELASCAPGLEGRLSACVQTLEDLPCEETSTPPACRLPTLCSP
ncbi:MAG: DUF6184 family natural product biosynthesis lipoprotein [Polyangiales bacterium]